MLSRTLPELGETLAGKYKLVRRIGEGGMGVVYEAVHVRIQQHVAIKMLLPEVLDVPDVVSRFEREARAAGQLRSENTARVLDVDVSEGGLPYMVMEYLEGNDLSQVLEARKQLPVAEAVDYVLQTCNAMAEAHAAGIVHRDLKPSNLFLCGGERPLVKVLDFGISKVENDMDTRVTATQTVVGTPLYMSPEQVRSAKHVDTRTDIWSLGIILYELLAGRTPFEGSTTAAAAAICIDEPPPLSQFRPDVPAELEQTIRTALEKVASARFPNVHSLAVAIGPFGSGTVRGPDPSQANIVLPRSQRSLPDASGSLPEVAPLASSSPHTLPGWSTRSGTAKRRSALVVGLSAGFGAAALIGVAALVLLRSSGAPPAPTAEPTHVVATEPSPPPPTVTATPSASAPAPSATGTTSAATAVAVPSAKHPRPTTTSRPRHPPPAPTHKATATTTPRPTPTRL